MATKKTDINYQKIAYRIGGAFAGIIAGSQIGQQYDKLSANNASLMKYKDYILLIIGAVVPEFIAKGNEAVESIGDSLVALAAQNILASNPAITGMMGLPTSFNANIGKPYADFKQPDSFIGQLQLMPGDKLIDADTGKELVINPINGNAEYKMDFKEKLIPKSDLKNGKSNVFREKTLTV